MRSTAIIGICLLTFSASARSASDADRGLAIFQACAACHSTQPHVQLTGPSLANIWQHKAATVPGFSRYSDALKKSGIVWNDETLNKWLTSPEALVPGTSMTFPGLQESDARQDVIAYLRSVAEGKAPAATERREGGMMMAPAPTRPDLKRAPARGQVTAIAHCGDTYSVKTADGKTNKVWEFNLRFKTDSSNTGPQPGKPVIVGAGMQGDRASIVFSSPKEISSFVKDSCE